MGVFAWAGLGKGAALFLAGQRMPWRVSHHQGWWQEVEVSMHLEENTQGRH